MISKKQYRFLKKMHLFHGSIDSGNKNHELFQFLAHEGLIKHANVREHYGYVVTQKGYSEMYAYKVEHFRFWLPTIISLFALATSILSLSSANPDFWKNAQELFSSVLN